MKVYICGKIGTLELTPEIKEKFEHAAALILDIHKRQNLPPPIVFNPCSDDHQAFLKSINKTSYAEILMYDLHTVHMCDIIYILPDWQDSPGARAEVALADALGKTLYYFTEGEIEDFKKKSLKNFVNTKVMCNFVPAEDIDATQRCDVVTYAKGPSRDNKRRRLALRLLLNN